MRCQARVIASAQGQFAANLPAAAAPAAHQAGGGVQDAVAQRLGLGLGQVAVEGEELEPGEQDLRDHRRGQPGLVERVVVGGELADAGVFAGADGVLDPGVDPVAGVDEAFWPRQPLVVAGRLVTHSW